jgi:pimeloyl-ACP methyl ester carboxylesterase
VDIVARGFTFDARVAGPVGGSAVLLLHGFPQHGGMWSGVVPALHAAGLRTIAPDQRGYSPGARPDGVAAYQMDECVTDALAILDALGVESAHVVGHDWGAAVGWHLAAKHAARVGTFTAISVPHPASHAQALGTDPDQKTRSAYLNLFRQPGRAEEVLLAADAARLRAMFGGLDPALVDEYVRPLREPGALTGPLNWYRAMSRRDLDGLGPSLVPTTYLWSDNDLAIGRTAAEGCAAYAVEDYEFVVVPGMSHWLPDEVPDLVNLAILDRVGAGSDAGSA